MTRYFWRLLDSPIGPLRIAWDDDEIVSLEAGLQLQRPLAVAGRCDPLAQAPVIEQLREYFGGVRRCFDLRLVPRGSDFQQRVWQELARIPFGETRSYGEVARRIGHPRAARAVGAACGRNPIAIVVPCHRVVGASGRLTGFAGGLATKARLLEHEARAAMSCVRRWPDGSPRGALESARSPGISTRPAPPEPR